MTIGIVRSNNLHFHVSTARAEKDFGYKPLFDTQEAINRTVDYLRELNGTTAKSTTQKKLKKK
jgi:hypothetical protein